MPSQNPYTPLLKDVSPFDVDFVIPRIGVDLPLGIDPFLLFKSYNPKFISLHKNILTAFNTAIEALQTGDLASANYLFDFPEVAEIGLGYTRTGKRGSGVGDYLTRLIIETLKDSPALMNRGVRHIEEMQLVAVGIAADRTSDIAANLIKQFLIEYTQKQCMLWDIPLASGVPVNHIFDPERFEWYDTYTDLPTSSIDNSPIIFVPRRIVRSLPWINYDDFFRKEFSAYLRAKRVKKQKPVQHSKEHITTITRQEIERINHYVDLKEETANQAQPSDEHLPKDDRCPEAERLKAELKQIPPGNDNAHKYQSTVLGVLNYLFNPELIDGEMEIRTVDGTERRDIIFTNDSDQSFWNYLRQEHSSFLIMFEAKNTANLKPTHYNQTATYLGDRLGRLGFIVTRTVITDANQKKAFSIYNDSHPRKIILAVSDHGLLEMLDMKCHGQNPMRFIQKMYRQFRQTVQ